LKNTWRECGISSNEVDCSISDASDDDILSVHDFLTLTDNGANTGLHYSETNVAGLLSNSGGGHTFQSRNVEISLK
jgi:hypothetical protein